MTRGSWLWDEEAQKWLPRHEVLARRAAQMPPKAVSAFPSPTVIGAMPEIRSPIDGRRYSDKSSYYRHVERAGCAIVGYDKNWTDHVKRPYDAKAHEADVVADVKKAIEQLNSGTAEPINAT